MAVNAKVAATRGISHAIGLVRDQATSMSTVAEEQGAVTSEITGNMSDIGEAHWRALFTGN